MDTKTLAGIRISHPERLVYPESHISKLELATYFYEIADWLLPHVADRPLALVRCPQGEGEECFFQKNFSDALPDSLHSVDLGDAIGIGLSDVKGLVALAQFGVMEIHPWGCRQEDIEHPDHITFDLDPGPGLGWAEVVEGAQAVRDVLKQLGLNSWVKTSGGKGLHICVPLKPDLTWDPVKEFCHGIATLLEQQRPDRYVSSMNKAKRNGRIFVDYLRNGRGATSVAAYSPRAREGAPVSVPVTWDEVGDLAGGNHFDLEKTLARVKTQKLEPWVDFFKEPQDLGSVLKQLQSE